MSQADSILPAASAAREPFFSWPPLPFALWLCVFYACWFAIVAGFDHWATVAAHWPIAVAMAAGSYFAGSTPMGGGTVGFPVLVLLFDEPASLGRSFGLAVQSIGMVSASIYLIAAGRRIDWDLLRPALVGSLIATPLGAAFMAPYAPDLGVKLLFATLWASFGVIHFAKLNMIVTPEGARRPEPALDRRIGFAIGLAGGVVASLTGVGIDMMIYAAMVMFYRADIKIAIPTSVILMAFTSVVGIASNIALAAFGPTRYALPPDVFHNWLAAAPVVAVGAPFGAVVVNRLPRKSTLLIVSVLCIAQFVWTLVQERDAGWPLLAALAGLLLLNLFFLYLFRSGERRVCGGPRESM